jgi:hypothetical protein
MSEVIRPRLAGICPYCGGMEFATIADRGARGVLQRCERSSCERYSTSVNGKQYPHAKPSDPDSTVTTVARI